MDKTKEFIKMCDCSEIQKCFQGWKDGDFYTVRKGGAAGMVLVWSSGEDEPPEFYEPIWLPRQDQIQKMCGFVDLNHAMSSVYGFYVDRIGKFGNKTWEQLWLAFYMYQKHKKVWKDKRWTNG